MKFNKLVPWNWFKKEEEQERSFLPVRRDEFAWPDWPLANLHREIDRIFEDFFRGMGAPLARWDRLLAPITQGGWFKPSVEIAAKDKEYTVSVELPGVNEKDVTLEVVGDTLRISGEKKQEREEKNQNYYRSERAYGAFQRLLTLPDDANTDGIQAVFKNGVLTVTIPRKASGESEAKRIEVKTS